MSPHELPGELVRHLAGLECAQWRLSFQAAGSARLPAWLGSAWRGLFGHALKEVACQCDAHASASCPLQASCPYIQLFQPESDGSRQLLHRSQAAPPPYVLRPGPGGSIQEGDELDVRLLLLGEGTRQAGLAVRTLFFGATRGLGEAQVPLVPRELQAIDASDRERTVTLDDLEFPQHFSRVSVSELPPWPGRIHLLFRSPVRIRLKNRYLGPNDLTFGDFIAQLLRRASLLQAFHGPDSGRQTSLDHRRWVGSARALQFGQSSFEWRDLARWSSRQRRKIPMGGLTGQCLIEGDEFEPFWPVIWLGQWLGVGKGATMGLGHYSCHPDDPAKYPQPG